MLSSLLPISISRSETHKALILLRCASNGSGRSRSDHMRRIARLTFVFGALACSWTLAQNLLTNPGFEQFNTTTGKPIAWTDNGFTRDTTVAHTGQASFRLTNANLIPYSQSASQTLQVKKGTYGIG